MLSVISRRVSSSLVRHWRFITYVFTSLLLLVIFSDAVKEIWVRWQEQRYSHAPLVFLLAIYLAWIKRHELTESNNQAWYGTGIVLFSSLLLMVGELSAIWTIVQYAMVFLLFGLAWSMLGMQMRKIIIPFLHILVVIPLPFMLDVMLSGKFQLWSSDLGVAIVRLLGLSVYQEGNVIDLGAYKLQVVEACSGLNYTYPLMTLGLMMGYIYKAPFYARAALFLSTIPISIVMNSFRIAMVAVFVNSSGIKAAEGFMHYFEGWVIFISCILILFLEVIIFNRLLGRNISLGESFDYQEVKISETKNVENILINKKPIALSLLLILLTSLSTLSVHHREEYAPPRDEFSHYPMEMAGWIGYRYYFQEGENDLLKFKDYLLADYSKANTNINIYLGYTESQRRGFVPHSPKACIPGGGWEISDTRLEKIEIDANKTIEVTRLLISKGAQKQIVYYWFHQRGRDLSNEFSMKFALLYDAIKLNRTDGAIVRFSTNVYKSETEADVKLIEFIRLNYPLFHQFIPN